MFDEQLSQIYRSCTSVSQCPVDIYTSLHSDLFQHVQIIWIRLCVLRISVCNRIGLHHFGVGTYGFTHNAALLPCYDAYICIFLVFHDI